jgi:hypothetical protein
LCFSWKTTTGSFLAVRPDNRGLDNLPTGLLIADPIGASQRSGKFRDEPNSCSFSKAVPLMIFSISDSDHHEGCVWFSAHKAAAGKVKAWQHGMQHT